MVEQRQVIRIGAAALILAIVLRLLGGGFFAPLFKALDSDGLRSALIYLQTGRPVRRPPASQPQESVQQPVRQPVFSPAPPVQEALPVFTEADLEAVEVVYRCDYRPALEPLLTQPLELSLKGGQPTVLIIHTHTTESYTKEPGQDYVEDVPYRTQDERYNMVAIGAEVARVLEAGGIKVIHDRNIYDYPSYNASYDLARAAIQAHLEQTPSIQMVLDIHRDASDGASGAQLTTSATVNGQPSAQLMVVVGTDAMGYYHPDWQQQLALGLKLTALLERTDPGLTRPLSLREYRFNTDLTPGSLLIEVGAAGNTQSEALLAANALARGILALSGGSD